MMSQSQSRSHHHNLQLSLEFSVYCYDRFHSSIVMLSRMAHCFASYPSDAELAASPSANCQLIPAVYA